MANLHRKKTVVLLCYYTRNPMRRLRVVTNCFSEKVEK